MTERERPALLLIDIQKGFDDIEYWGGDRNNPEAEKRAGQLLLYWRENRLPVFHVKHCSTNPESRLAEGKIGNDFMDVVKPEAGEPVIRKNVNSAFIGTDLKQQLDALNVKTVVIAGLTTDHCVSTTTRMAGNFGYETYLVADACSTFDKVGVNGQKFSAQIIHDTALASLHNEFATVIQADELLKLIGDSKVSI
ncbi:cysteine hydrolase family protein [Sabulibacter ruber]|uniref:cysteine hydrolase family protein n=1 Tax=Sabulibacter ruber TaxID=2811901 RepID=UPI001A95E7DB|nr:cysteine hydrolase family protein [Sabulibacter ruber]